MRSYILERAIVRQSRFGQPRSVHRTLTLLSEPWGDAPVAVRVALPAAHGPNEHTLAYAAEEVLVHGVDEIFGVHLNVRYARHDL